MLSARSGWETCDEDFHEEPVSASETKKSAGADEDDVDNGGGVGEMVAMTTVIANVMTNSDDDQDEDGGGDGDGDDDVDDDDDNDDGASSFPLCGADARIIIYCIVLQDVEQTRCDGDDWIRSGFVFCFSDTEPAHRARLRCTQVRGGDGS